MPDEIQAFAWRKERQGNRDELDDLVERAWARRSQKRFQLGKCEFDRIEVGAIRRQKSQPSADAFDRGLYLGLFMDDEVVEHDDVAGPQRRHEDLLDVGEKRGIVDRPIEHRGGGHALHPEGGDHGVRLPVPARGVVAEAHAARTPAIPAQQICGDPGFVDDDVAARIVERLRVLPPPPGGGDISAPLFVGVYRFF
jgi:hypothetical protein